MKYFVLGAIAAYGLGAVVLFSSASLGLLPVQADVAPSRLEAGLLGFALRASVARHAPRHDNPMPTSEENLIAGARIYRQMCSRCHGVSKESGSPYGDSFYPPAPHLPTGRTSYTDSEMFWIVKHGIRNTRTQGPSSALARGVSNSIIVVGSEERVRSHARIATVAINAPKSDRV